jgi:hypothetical protein
MEPKLRIPVDPPMEVGAVTALQAAEIRARNELIRRTEQLVSDQSVLLRIAGMERVNYVRAAVEEAGLTLDKDYHVDDDGKIWLIAVPAPDAPEEPVPLNREQRRQASRKKATG